MVVTKKGHLILGENKKIALYNEYEIENLPKIENYGKITGRIVLNTYQYNVSYSVEDYISGDGVFTYNDAIWGA